MTRTESSAQGGLARWAPRVTPPIGVDLTPEQALACAFRILAGIGFSENVGGHITYVDGTDGSMLVNPWGLWWEEIAASDLCRVDSDGVQVAGRWDVTPAIHIHTELHRLSADARVIIHNHPYYATVLAAIGAIPEMLHQTASMFDGDLCFVDEYDGEVDDAEKGAALARQIGGRGVAILANHGVIVTGPSLAQATYRAASLERMCRLTYDVLVSGREFTTVAPSVRGPMKASLLERAAEVYWNGAVRQLLAEPRNVLD